MSSFVQLRFSFRRLGVCSVRSFKPFEVSAFSGVGNLLLPILKGLSGGGTAFRCYFVLSVSVAHFTVRMWSNVALLSCDGFAIGKCQVCLQFPVPSN